MKEGDMGRVASFMQRAVFGSQSSKQLRSEIEVFVAEFQNVHFSFDPVQRQPLPQGPVRI
jgi:hypothetical protein